MAPSQTSPTATSPAAVESRIGWMTLTIGGIAALATAGFAGWRWGAGVAAGAGLAWLNARWLGQMLDAMMLLSTAQAGAPRPRISRWTYVKFFFRYALIGLAAYVMILLFRVPVVSILAGLLALGGAVLVQFGIELVGRQRSWNTTSANSPKS